MRLLYCKSAFTSTGILCRLKIISCPFPPPPGDTKKPRKVTYLGNRSVKYNDIVRMAVRRKAHSCSY